MRDVTDNVTGELLGVDQKRGRGRPRKAHAMTNAERQAAFRARRKKEQAGSDRSVTVTKRLVDVDAYDDCQVQVDALRFEMAEMVAQHNQMATRLLEAVREKEIAWREMRAKRDKAEELSRELFQLKKQLLQQKSVTPSNGNPISWLDMCELVALASRARTYAAREGIRDTELWQTAVVRCVAVSQEQMKDLSRALTGGAPSRRD